MEAKLSLFTIQKVHGAKVIHHRLRGEERGLSSPLMNNFWTNYKGRGEVGFPGFSGQVHGEAAHGTVATMFCVAGLQAA